MRTKKNNLRISAIVQARTSSTRLPKKVLVNIENKPMLLHVINRLKLSKKIDEIILAMPDCKEDDVLEEFANKYRIEYYRGSRDNVLSRYYGAAKKYHSDVIVRITSDCPLIDPAIVDLVVSKHLNAGADYTSNVMKRTFPRGLDVEVFNFGALDRANREASEEYEKEHVTPYIYEHPEMFKLENLEATTILRRPDLRLTVDTEEDLRLMKEIYGSLYRKNMEYFSIEKVIELFNSTPELAKINSHIEQKKLK